MGLENVFADNFKHIEFPYHSDMVYIIGIRDTSKGFFPFYVGRTGRFTGRMGDYGDAYFDLRSIPDFHVGRAIRFFQSNGRIVEVKYKLSDNMTTEEKKWKQTIKHELPKKLKLLEEPFFEPVKNDSKKELDKVQRFCDDFLEALDKMP